MDKVGYRKFLNNKNFCGLEYLCNVMKTISKYIVFGETSLKMKMDMEENKTQGIEQGVVVKKLKGIIKEFSEMFEYLVGMDILIEDLP